MPDTNTLSLAQNIQKITQVLSQKISSFNKQVLQNNRPQEALIKSPQKQAIPGKFQVVETAKTTKRGTRNPNDSSDDEVDVGDELK